MSVKYSNKIQLGINIKPFKLLDPESNNFKSLDELKSKIATVIMFICNHCPFVKKINKELIKIGNDYINKGVSLIAINSNDYKSFPEDSPEKMIYIKKKLKYPFPYLLDKDQYVAKMYNASCTPDFFIFGRNEKLFYHGQLDDSRPYNDIITTGENIRIALNDIINRKKLYSGGYQKPSIGCSIKWI